MDLDAFEGMWCGFVSDFRMVCRRNDASWQKRRRVIDTEILVLLILKAVWSKGNLGLKTVISQFWGRLKDFGISRWQKTPISASSFTEARQKLDEIVFVDLNRCLIDRVDQAAVSSAARWNKMRLFAIDGSIVNLPRELLGKGYKLRNQKSFYPLGLISCLYELRTGIPHDFALHGHMNERFAAEHHLQRLGSDDLVIYDRGYFSYALLSVHAKAGVPALFRLKSLGNFAAIQSFIKDSSRTDDVVTIYPEHKETRYGIKKQYPDIEFRPLQLRVFKHPVQGKMWIFATTLLDQVAYPAAVLGSLYGERWGIEELFKSAKVSVNFEEFHSKSERGVKQEIYGAFLLVTMARMFSNKANELLSPAKTSQSEKSTANEKPQRTNFKHALTCLADNLEALFIRGSTVIKATLRELINQMTCVRQRIRPGRKYERKSMLPVNKWRRFTVNSGKNATVH